ncbi:hypothetical protein JHK84_046797 [Glycine max]|nr:hypothetical protein JHK85_047352 [Glycine max]KAG5101828.1 hypothetical protein JHK84_046797 [Glycine max]
MASLPSFAPFVFLLLVIGSNARTLYPLPSKGGNGSRKPLQTFRPYNIAHRGSNGELPEETRPAYLRAIEEGADFIETDVLSSKDGVLICFHDVTLDDTTDIANHTGFANRKRTYEVQGINMTGFFPGSVAELAIHFDFTLKELKSLRVKQRYSFRDQQFNDGTEGGNLLYNEKLVLNTQKQRYWNRRNEENAVKRIQPELKHRLCLCPPWPKPPNPLQNSIVLSTIFHPLLVKWSHGKRFEDKFVETLQKYGYKGSYLSKDWLRQPVFIQSFAPTSLVYISNKTDLPKIFLIDDVIVPTQDTNQYCDDNVQSFWEITSDEYLDYIKQYVVGIGPWKDTVVPVVENYMTNPTNLVARAHAHNLQVHPYTYRNEFPFLHFNFSQDPYMEYDYWINKIGVDGLFTDFTGSLHRYQEWTSNHKDDDDKNLLHKIALLVSSYE